MRTGLEPCALNDGGLTAYCRANQIGFCCASLDLARGREINLWKFFDKTGAQRSSLVTRAVPDMYLF